VRDVNYESMVGSEAARVRRLKCKRRGKPSIRVNAGHFQDVKENTTCGESF
jgi:hypothetical protein